MFSNQDILFINELYLAGQEGINESPPLFIAIQPEDDRQEWPLLAESLFDEGD